MMTNGAIKRLLVCNRGEIAARIISTARELDIETYSIYTTNDGSHCRGSTRSIQLKSPASYLDISELVEIIKNHKIDAVHPGYGFLSESPEFAQRVWEDAGAVVVGPGPGVLVRTGDKLQARLLAEECQVPVLPALTDPTRDLEDLRKFAKSVGFPIIVKAVDGGGGRGIRIVQEEDELESLAKRALQESPSGLVFAEKAAINGYRHVEIQIIGDGKGDVRHLWERECSIQRRFQKVIEFAPSSIQDQNLVAKVIDSALKMARKINYYSLGTFEFLVNPGSSEYYFLEVNPRIQVEHTVTESIAGGIDLVRLQLLLAQGHKLSSMPVPVLPSDPASPPPIQHSLQLRLTAEDPSHNFSLSVGKISSFNFPSGNGVRVDTHMISSQPLFVGTDFDSLLAKIIITAPTWEDVVRKANRALEDTFVVGVRTNLDVLRGVLATSDFRQQNCDTQWLEENISSLLESGEELSKRVPRISLSSTSSGHSASVAAPSNVLFRKGDAWSLSLTPETANSKNAKQSHLKITSVQRNQFPDSLTASIVHTTATSSTPYTLTLSSTNESSGSLTSFSRRGDPRNSSHVIIPFAGKLMEVCFDEGDKVKKGETIAVVRQMKMELEVRANKSGRVGWVYEGEEGDDVGEGILVAIIDDESPKL